MFALATGLYLQKYPPNVYPYITLYLCRYTHQRWLEAVCYNNKQSEQLLAVILVITSLVNFFYLPIFGMPGR